MKNIKILWAIIVALGLIVFGAGYQLITGSTVVSSDGRTAIVLTKNERNFVLGEMRGLLGHIQQLVAAAADRDIDKTIAIAKRLNSDSQGEKQVGIIAKTPLNFKKITANIHSQFGKLYEDSVKKRDANHSLKQVSMIMQNCIACHGAYTIIEEQK